MKKLRSVLAATTIAATTLVLSGCYTVGVRVDSPQGIGVCYDTEAVTLSVTQNSAGDQVNVVYDGPTDVTLVAYQGLYSDSRFWEESPTESMLFSYPIDASSDVFAITALDTDTAPWDVTTTGDNSHIEFDGTMDQFIDELDYVNAGQSVNFNDFDQILPITVAVVCDTTMESTILETPDVDADDILEEFEVAIAQPMFPNFMYADAPVITRQTAIEYGISGKMKLPAELADAFSGGASSYGAELEVNYLGDIDPFAPATEEQPFSLTGATLGDVWYLTLISTYLSSGSEGFVFTDDISLTEPIDFEFTAQDSEPQEGYYMFSVIVGDDIETPENYKVSTSVFYYSGERGMTFSTIDAPITLEKLAATGGDPNAIIWAVLGGLVVLAAVFLRPKRRKAQADSTNVPSDLKE